MLEIYKFGIMLERLEFDPHTYVVTFDPPGVAKTATAKPVVIYWRVFSARLHGPLMFTRRAAFFSWLKNWLTDFVSIKLRR